MSITLTATLCPPGPPTLGWVTIDGDRIGTSERGPRRRGATHDLGPAVLAPGFLDLQVNGIGDVDFAVVDTAGWRRARDRLLAAGTTAICPTLVTAPLDSYGPALERLAALQASEDGPGLLGVHLEGPYLGGAPGAHPVDLVRRADADWLAGTLDAHPGLVRVVTLAPEADPSLVTIRLLVQRGVTVALGHSTASYDEASARRRCGRDRRHPPVQRHGPVHHREPGLAGAALDHPHLSPTVIADFVHVHPAALRLVFAAKRSVALVTDSVAVDAGRVGEAVSVAERDGRRRASLTGRWRDRRSRSTKPCATSSAWACRSNARVEMASTVPAELLGLTDRGRIARGARADLVALDPESLAVRAVWLAGELVYGDVASA